MERDRAKKKKKKKKAEVVASGVREQLAKKKKVAINKSYCFIVGADAMFCKIKKEKLTHPTQKHTHTNGYKGISISFFFFFQKLLMGD